MSGDPSQLRLLPPLQHQLPPFDYTPIDSNGKLHWPPFANCVMCKGRRDQDISDIELYSGCDFMHLKCLHFICSSDCLKTLVEMFSPPVCPVCKLKFDPQEVKKRTYRPLEMVGAVPKTSGLLPVVLCTCCLREEEGVAWCESCAEVLCKQCQDFHKYSKTTHDHTITEEVGTERKSKDGQKIAPIYRCQMHEKQVLSQFCQDCDTRLCDLCIHTDARHKDHKITSVEHCVKEIKDYMNSSAEYLPTVFAAAIQTERLLTEKANMCLTAESEYLKRETAKNFQLILSAIMKKELELRKEISRITTIRAKVHCVKRAKVKSVLLQLENYKNIIGILRHCTDEQILLDSRHIVSRFQDLKNQCEMFFDKSKRSVFVEEGYHFMMERTVVSNVEALIKNDLGKINYEFNPHSTIHQAYYAHHANEMRKGIAERSSTTNSSFGDASSSEAERRLPAFQMQQQQQQTSSHIPTSGNNQQMTRWETFQQEQLQQLNSRQASSTSNPNIKNSPLNFKKSQECVQSTTNASKTPEPIDTVSPFKIPLVPPKHVAKRSPNSSSLPTGSSRVRTNVVARKRTSGYIGALMSRSLVNSETARMETNLLADDSETPSSTSNSAIAVRTNVVARKKTSGQIGALRIRSFVNYETGRMETDDSEEPSSTSNSPVATESMSFSPEKVTIDVAGGSEKLSTSVGDFYGDEVVVLDAPDDLEILRLENYFEDPPQESDEPVIVYESLVNVVNDEIVMDWDAGASVSQPNIRKEEREDLSSSDDSQVFVDLPSAAETEVTEEGDSQGSGGTDTTECVDSPDEKCLTTPGEETGAEEVRDDSSSVADTPSAESCVKPAETLAKKDGKAGTKEEETIVDSEMPHIARTFMRHEVLEVCSLSSQSTEEMTPPEGPQLPKLPAIVSTTPNKAQHIDESCAPAPSGKRVRKKRSLGPEYVTDFKSLGRLRKTPPARALWFGKAKQMLNKSMSSMESDFEESQSTPIKRKRGRPKGSRNKPVEDKNPTTSLQPKPLPENDESIKSTEDDNNENFCDKCGTGGQEILICCDNPDCSKVFHLECFTSSCTEPGDAASSSSSSGQSTQCSFCKM